MIQTVIYAIYFGAVIFASIFILFPPYLILSFPGLHKKRDRLLQTAGNIWGKLMIWGTGSKVAVKGLENIPPDGNFLFVGNHQSNIDILIILGYMPRQIGFIAKSELSWIPVFSNWMKAIHCLFLDRASFRDASKVIARAAEHLKNGNSLVIFPEGHRSKGPQMRPFKRGSFKLAITSGTNIIPFTVSGTYKAMEEFGIRPAQIKLTIHPPVYIKDLSEEELKNLSKTIEEKIASAL